MIINLQKELREQIDMSKDIKNSKSKKTLFLNPASLTGNKEIKNGREILLLKEKGFLLKKPSTITLDKKIFEDTQDSFHKVYEMFHNNSVFFIVIRYSNFYNENLSFCYKEFWCDMKFNIDFIFFPEYVYVLNAYHTLFEASLRTAVSNDFFNIESLKMTFIKNNQEELASIDEKLDTLRANFEKKDAKGRKHNKETTNTGIKISHELTKKRPKFIENQNICVNLWYIKICKHFENVTTANYYILPHFKMANLLNQAELLIE